MPLILVQNEVTVDGKYDHWQDDEGVQYHFPNQYIGKVKEGESFIYYRGSRRINKKRGTPEYFGCGKIGRVWLDPETDIKLPRMNWHWYCEIVDYIPFQSPVPFKINNIPFEKIAPNQWSVAVRNIDIQDYQAILSKASIPVIGDEALITPKTPILPAIEEVQPTLISSQSLLLVPPADKKNSPLSGNKGKPGSYVRYSRNAKLYGDRAEEIVYQLLTKNNTYKLRWVAKDKETPGWDLEYYENENLIAIEVKGTSGKRFLNVDLTAGEWNAAKAKGPDYKLYLVADCLSKQPKIQVINNIYDLYQRNKIFLEPTVYKMSLIESF